MIELLPGHKTGLPLISPVLIAAGFAGYGNAFQHLLDLSLFGAVVTQPITLRPLRGAAQPRLAEIEGGLVLATGRQNPGVKKVLQGYRRTWDRLPTKVIAHLPADEPGSLMRTARALSENSALAGLELDIPALAYLDDVLDWVRAIRDGSELPLLARLPFGADLGLVDAALEAGADGLVVSAPPPAAVRMSDSEQILSGGLYGYTVHSLILQQVQTIAAQVDAPLIAAGGIHSVKDAHDFLTAGAAAVQLDSLLLRDPAQAEAIAQALLSD